ncbi:MAG: D-ribose pyranase [Clostridiales bacterium]|nr:D-ribose pyranase [Clostridiales bacterium]
MRKGILLNSEILKIISQMGHTDTIAIGDCGLPIPKTTKRIDIALKRGIPNFLETLDTVLNEFEVEGVVLAEEIKEHNPAILEKILLRIDGSKIIFVSHKAFKKLTEQARAVIRTGENTPYANIILQSGVVL